MYAFIFSFDPQDSWTPSVTWLVGKQIEDQKHIDVLNAIVQSGTRKLFSVVTKDSLYSDVSNKLVFFISICNPNIFTWALSIKEDTQNFWKKTKMQNYNSNKYYKDSCWNLSSLSTLNQKLSKCMYHYIVFLALML